MVEYVLQKVLITKGWGFTVVSANEIHEGKEIYWLLLYTLNGDFIRKKKIQSPVKKWITYKSQDGFDWIVFSNAKGEVYHFEVFYMEIGKNKLSNDLYRTSSNLSEKLHSNHIDKNYNQKEVVSIEYHRLLQLIIIVFSDGTIAYISLDNNDPNLKC